MHGFFLERNMRKITIDGREFEYEQLSENAKAQLSSLQFVDVELQRLQAQIAVMQTARAAYAKSLNEELPAVNSEYAGDTIKFV